MSEDIDAFPLDLYLITRTYFVIKREQTFSFGSISDYPYLLCNQKRTDLFLLLYLITRTYFVIKRELLVVWNGFNLQLKHTSMYR